MPYSGADDPGLPPDIKKLDAKKRAQFAAVWNDAYANCRKSSVGGGAGTQSDCEGVAFRFARGAVKEMEMEDEKEGRVISTANLQKIRDALTVLEDLLSAGTPPAAKEIDETPGLVERILDGIKGLFFGSKAEWDTVWINNLPDSAFAYIEPGGDKDDEGKTVPRALRHFPYKGADGEVDLPHLRNALARAAQSPFGPKAMPKLRAAAEAANVGEFAKKDIYGTFTAFKASDGKYRWLTVTTNKYRDRDGEIFSEAAHKEYVAHVDATHLYPELWLWHVPGSHIGSADFVDYADGFVLHSGTFDDESVGERLAASKGLGVSHGFKYQEEDREDGVLDWYRTFEVSILPAERAANAWTRVAVERKEAVMPVDTEKRPFLVDKLGEERVKAIEDGLGKFSKELEEAGIDFKELAEAITPEAKVEEAKPDDRLDDIAKKLEALPNIAERLEKIEGELTGVKTRLDTVEKTDAEKIDDKLAPRRQPPNGEKSPTSSEENTLTKEEAEKVIGAQTADPVDPYVRDIVKPRATG